MRHRVRGPSAAVAATARLGCVALAAALAAACGGGGAGAEPVRVVIPRGASLRVASESLAAGGIVRAPRLFRWYAGWTGRDRAIKPGTYALRPAMRWRDLLAALVEGRGLVRTVVVREGLDLRDIAPLLARELGVPEDSVRAAAADSAWRARLGVPVATLEGYLFPATYTFPEGTTAREAVVAMLERFEAAWRPEWASRLDTLRVTRHEAVTMASLVETEARVAEDRPLVAAVYWNRVRKGMRLQADPTVQYALPRRVERVLYAHLQVASPYNTYRVEGLPPGPIASPGEASLAAALYPAAVPYLYFVAHPDGHHEFRTTFAEHQRAIAMVRREAARRAAARDSAATDARADGAAPRDGGAGGARRP
jgi:UPF0755 protein